MTDVLWLVIGAIAGAVVAWVLASVWARAAAAADTSALRESLARREAAETEARRQLAAHEETLATLRSTLDAERQQRVASETRIEETRRNIEEQRRLLTEAEVKLKDAFTALSSEALKRNNETFVGAADERVKPLKESLERYEKLVKELEVRRTSAYDAMNKQVADLKQTSDRLQRETTTLGEALRNPRARGQWGELSLVSVCEAAGMSSNCDFVEQQSSDSSQGVRMRPDLIVRLPGGRSVIVDSKVPMDAYLIAASAGDESARSMALDEHARAVRKHVDSLASRGYAADTASSADFVVMYLPNEAIFSAAVQTDVTLINDAAAKGIVLASPTTLIALLRAVAHGWQQQQMAANAEKLADAGRELFERVCTFAAHLAKLGDGIKKVGETFNAAVGSWESRVVPGGRLLKELGAARADEEFPALRAVSNDLRTLPALPDTPEPARRQVG